MKPQPEQTTMTALWEAIDRETMSLERLHAMQLETLEAALKRAGIHHKTTAHRLARMIFHLTKKNGQPFTWTAKEIADDDYMNLASGKPISPRSVQRAVGQLRRLGIIEQAFITEKGRGIDHASRVINWENVRKVEAGQLVAIDTTADRATDRATASAIDGASDSATDRATDCENGDALYSSLPVTKKTDTATATPATWGKVRAEICKYVNDWPPALEHVQAVGLTPGDVLDVLEYFEAAGGAFTGGALRWRLLRSAPGIPPASGWPPLADPDGKERRACDLLARARKWQQLHGKTDAETLHAFTRSATDKGLADFTTPAIFREHHSANDRATA